MPKAAPKDMPRPRRTAQERLQRLLGDYRVPEGVADELFEAEGRMRPVWAPFMAELARLSPGALAARFARGDHYLQDAGVFFRQYTNEPQPERDWPLSHIPVLLDEREWAGIAAGLEQRAELLEAVMADLYGTQDLVSDGHLPPELLAQNPEWLQPMVGIAPRSGHYLHFLAFEIGRNPDGSWFVLGDRTQAPSGAGFALENRMATSRVFSEPFPRANVHRLAGFFRAFREAMDGLRDETGSRTAILTPGPNNDTYFEHAFIARYLGLMLLEGEDLMVADGRVMVRTVAGPQPVSVIWRRMDARFADPLALDEASRIGTPGLVSALRAGSLTMVNALGAGVLETRAFMAFLPRICRVLRGEPLLMSNIATWWCGQAVERAHVRENAGRMLIGDAFSRDLPFDSDARMVLGGVARDPGVMAGPLDEWIEREGPRLAGQEAVTLSTTPAHRDGKIVPRPMTVRVFAARTPEGWRIMPGGYARIGRTEDATALAMQRGGSVADVWVVSDAPVPQETMAPEPAGTSFRRVPRGILPSRAADNLYWLGRYVERAEGTLRLLRAYHLRLAETGDPKDLRVAALRAYLDSYGIKVAEPVPARVLGHFRAAVTCAGKVRERFSTDGWGALRDLSMTAERMAGTVRPGDDAGRAMGVLLRKLAGFSGLVQENMYRFAGWRFLSLGRAIERADALASVLASFADEGAPQGSLDLAVELGDSVMTHRRRYRVETNRNTVVDLLALDDSNPRAILFQVNAMHELIATLPDAERDGQLSPLSRAVLLLRTELMVLPPEEFTTARIRAFRAALGECSVLLAQTYLR